MQAVAEVQETERNSVPVVPVGLGAAVTIDQTTPFHRSESAVILPAAIEVAPTAMQKPLVQDTEANTLFKAAGGAGAVWVTHLAGAPLAALSDCGREALAAPASGTALKLTAMAATHTTHRRTSRAPPPDTITRRCDSAPTGHA